MVDGPEREEKEVLFDENKHKQRQLSWSSFVSHSAVSSPGIVTL